MWDRIIKKDNKIILQKLNIFVPKTKVNTSFKKLKPLLSWCEEPIYVKQENISFSKICEHIDYS